MGLCEVRKDQAERNSEECVLLDDIGSQKT